MAPNDQHTDTNRQKSRRFLPSTYVPLVKDSLDLFHHVVILLVAALFFVFPNTFNRLVERAGFQGGEFLGLKLSRDFAKADQELKEARVTITDLRTQLGKTQQALFDAQAKVNDPALSKEVADLHSQNEIVDQASSRVIESVNSTITNNAPTIEKAVNSFDISGKWGVIFSGDSTIKDAKYEVTNGGPSVGLNNISIYHRQNSYRSVVVTNTRSEADQVLPLAKKRRSDAYIVNMSIWCPTAIPKGDYFECSGQ